MRKSRFTDEQPVGIIREADRHQIGEAAKRHGEQTIYTWRKRVGELRSEDVRRLRRLWLLSPLSCQLRLASDVLEKPDLDV